MKITAPTFLALACLTVLSASAQGIPADRLITADSAGVVKLGMTVAQVREAVKPATVSRTSDGEGIALVQVSLGEVPLMSLYAGEEDPAAALNEEAAVEFIEVWSADYKTAGGVHPGMVLSEAEKSYGSVRGIMVSEIESREYAEFSNEPPGMTFRLNNDAGTAGIYGEGEMRTTRYAPAATILTVSVSGLHIMADGTIGGLKIGSSQDEVKAVAEGAQLGVPSKGEDVVWEAIGQAVQTWTYAAAGLTINMVSDQPGGVKSVFSIALEGPSTLKTGEGIGIGSPKDEVVKAYAGFRTEAEEAEGFFEGQDVHLVGSIYGGMVFTFTDGKVSRIFFGASAE